jgi:hypothetical protein
MLVAVHLLTRRLFTVPFDWPRLARIVGDPRRHHGGGRAALPTERLPTGFSRAHAALALHRRARAPAAALELRRVAGSA